MSLGSGVVEPPPPPITIVNPNAPAGTSDLLDSGRYPWRPSRKQKVLIALTALAVALVSGLVAEVRHVRHEHALDAAAVADVSLAVQVPKEWDGGDETVLLLNGGSLPVHVIGVALVGQGYRERHQDVAVPRGVSVDVKLSAAKNCRPAMFTEQPQQVRVRVRTSRGDVVTRTLDLPDEMQDRIGMTERQQCGFLRPAEALGNQLVAAKRQGRDVVVTLEVFNQGVLPLTLTTLTGLVGVRASASLPVTLPRRAFWTGRSHATRLSVTLRVTNCRSLAESFSTPEVGEVVVASQSLQVGLKNAYVSGEGIFWLQDYIDDAQPGGPRPVDIQGLLAETCPDSLFPQRRVVSVFQ